jgi:hypothetical protein
VTLAEGAVEIHFPTEDDAAFELLDGNRLLLERDTLTRESASATSQERFSYVYVVMVSVRIVSVPNEVDDIVHSLAERVVRNFVDWHRVRGQTWLGLYGRDHERLSRERYIDEDTGKPPSYTVTIDLNEVFASPEVTAAFERFRRNFDVASDRLSLLDVAARLSQSEEPSLARQMLSDALYFGDQAHPESDRALLFAAIACELKIKEILELRTAPPQKALVAVLLNNPRDFSIQVSGLFDKVLKAALGVSLREVNKDLFKKIEVLFQRRNQIAHRGHTAKSESADSLRAAVELFEWLDALKAFQE